MAHVNFKEFLGALFQTDVNKGRLISSLQFVGPKVLAVILMFPADLCMNENRNPL